MKLFSVIPVLASLPALSAAYASIGGQCSGNSYDCADTYHSIAVCNGATWQLAATCGDKYCIWPAGELSPRCEP